MFNRQPFNKGKYNVSFYQNTVDFYGFIDLALEASARINAISNFQGTSETELSIEGNINYSVNMQGNAEMELLLDGAIIKSISFDGSSIMLIHASGEIVRQRFFDGEAGLVLEVTSQGFNTYRYEYIKLPDLILRTGDELIINTDEMTVTLNGQNVIQYLSRDSEFFLFNPRENDIIYTSGNANDKVDIKILWKDAFL